MEIQTNYMQGSPIINFLFTNRKMAVLWLIVRLYVGWEWLVAGWDKINNPIWAGSHAGGAVAGFVQGALGKMAGTHPDVSSWYGYFLEHVVLPHTTFWSNLVAYGEFLVGVALIIGIFTGVVAFFGAFMNFNYLLAGTVSTNPVLLILGLLLMFSWRIAGYFGLDYFILNLLGTPWQKGKLFDYKLNSDNQV